MVHNKESIVNSKLSRVKKIQRLREVFFEQGFAEDYQDGTIFDCDILDALKKLEERYSEKYRVIPSNDWHLDDIAWDNPNYTKFTTYSDAVKEAESRVHQFKISFYIQLFDEDCIGDFPKTIARVVPRINTEIITIGE